MRDLDPDVLLIADAAGPLGLAGVMGGAGSEVSDTTTAVVVESAIFDPVSIRRTAFRYALRSEASLRFEKGQESRLARVGADRTAQLILRWAGGRAASGAIDSAPHDPPLATLAFRPARVSRLLGIDIAATEQAALLERVGIDTAPAKPGTLVPVIAADLTVPVEGKHDALVATIPSHRRDLVIEADIAEEIARVRGYETQPGRLPDTAMPAYREDPWRLTDQLRTLLAGRGLSEVVTHGLISPDDHAGLGFSGRRPGHHPRPEPGVRRAFGAAALDAAGSPAAPRRQRAAAAPRGGRLRDRSAAHALARRARRDRRAGHPRDRVVSTARLAGAVAQPRCG